MLLRIFFWAFKAISFELNDSMVTWMVTMSKSYMSKQIGSKDMVVVYRVMFHGKGSVICMEEIN